MRLLSCYVVRYRVLLRWLYYSRQIYLLSITFADIHLQKLRKNKEIALSNKMFNLLAMLMENAELVLSREQILTKIWGWDFDGDERVVDTHIKMLRKALGDKAVHIKTVIGKGYSFRKE